MKTLKVATYNIHKGLSHFNRRVVLHELRARLRELDADIVFLQEVQGEHSLHGKHYHNYPAGSQHEFIAEEVWPHSAYGKNSVYEAGHHGNAILSRFPILQSLNTDVSAHRFESRGLLHCEIELPNLLQSVVEQQRVHCLCVHFGLFATGRRAQIKALIEYVRDEIPADAPLIIAGDFNDWRNQLGKTLSGELGIDDAFHLHRGNPARSFPSGLPMLRLDRIYVRGFDVLHSSVHDGAVWRRLSDHVALSASLKCHDPVDQVSDGHQVNGVNLKLLQNGAAGAQWIRPAAISTVPTADPVSQTIEWRLELPSEAAKSLLPGQQTRVRFVGGRADRRVVPAAAVLRRGELTAVYVAAAKGFSLKAVRLGAEHGADGVEVVAGLSDGDRVALDPVKAGLAGAQPAAGK